MKSPPPGRGIKDDAMTALLSVLYWTCTGIAVFLTLGTVIVLILGSLNALGYESQNNAVEAFVFIPALAFWLLALAFRHFLFGR
jgi:hypothetical protein